MSGTTHFRHRWATAIVRHNPWYARSANRCVDVEVTDHGLRTRLMPPFNFGLGHGWGFEKDLSHSEITGVESDRYMGGSTVRVDFIDPSGDPQSFELLFTSLTPFSLFRRRGAVFMNAMNAARASGQD